MNEAQARAKIVDIMRSWIGLKESDGSHMRIIDIYNEHRPQGGYRMTKTDPWCAATVSAAAIATGFSDAIPADCSCSAMIAKLKSMGIWQENDAHTPKPGDYIFYDWQDSGKGDDTGAPDHVGIVEKVSGKTITVIEGNYHNCVKRRTLSVDGRYIRGYGVPNYAAVAASMTGTQRQESAASKSVYLTAQEVLDGKWGNGEERKERLKAAGYNPAEVQAVANALHNGTLRVSVTAAALNVRSGAGIEFATKDQLYYGTNATVTRVKEGKGSDSGWGKTFSGWIALDHVRRLA